MRYYSIVDELFINRSVFERENGRIQRTRHFMATYNTIQVVVSIKCAFILANHNYERLINPSKLYKY